MVHLPDIGHSAVDKMSHSDYAGHSTADWVLSDAGVEYSADDKILSVSDASHSVVDKILPACKNAARMCSEFEPRCSLFAALEENETVGKNEDVVGAETQAVGLAPYGLAVPSTVPDLKRTLAVAITNVHFYSDVRK